MAIDKEKRAEINRQNAQKSTGPTSEAGKAASRANALKYGLAATTIAPIESPGEPEGAYQARLDAWVADMQPRNVLELAMIQRACRASWKLDRCARYEDAAASYREARADDDPERLDRRAAAERLGNSLMFPLNHHGDRYDQLGPLAKPSPYDDAPRDVEALGRSREGVEWLFEAWGGVIPYLPEEGAPPVEGSEEFHAQTRRRALRLLGIPTGAPPPAQSLREAGEAEARRLQWVLIQMDADPRTRLGADRCLFRADPASQLVMRYEAQAERELHRAVATFLKLRKNPELLEPVAEVTPVTASFASPGSGEPPQPRTRPAPSPSRNEASPPDRTRPTSDGYAPREGIWGPRNGGS